MNKIKLRFNKLYNLIFGEKFYKKLKFKNFYYNHKKLMNIIKYDQINKFLEI